jgi:hypothetical protein
MSTEMREGLLSQFTAWNNRLVQTGQAPEPFVKVTIEAGYSERRSENLAVVFKGEVAMVDPSSTPPDIGVKITCFTRQVDKTKWVTNRTPSSMRFYDLVAWVSDQIGFGSNFVCETSFNDTPIENPARSIQTVAGLIPYIQDLYKPDVAAFIDDDVLIVKDRDKVISREQLVPLDVFVGIPSWTEWGVEFTTIFNPSIRLAGAVNLTSKMNPGVNGNYVLTSLEYDLNSRDRAFYVKGFGSPPSA